MRSVPGAVATGLSAWATATLPFIETQPLPLPVLTPSSSWPKISTLLLTSTICLCQGKPITEITQSFTDFVRVISWIVLSKRTKSTKQNLNSTGVRILPVFFARHMDDQAINELVAEI